MRESSVRSTSFIERAQLRFWCLAFLGASLTACSDPVHPATLTADTVVALRFESRTAEVSADRSLDFVAYAMRNSSKEPAGAFRNLTPDIIRISSPSPGHVTVTGLSYGTGLVVVEQGQFADTLIISATYPSVVSIATGAQHTCALNADFSVYCWGAVPGAAASGESCGAAQCVREPRVLDTTVRMSAIAAGGNQNCGLSDGQLWCWGKGDAVPGGSSASPRKVSSNLNFQSLSLGPDHACALSDGAAYCWGSNLKGQLGIGNRTAATTPQPVSTNEKFSVVRAGPQFTCGLTTSSAVLCWGANFYGQLGRGTFTDSELDPAPISLKGSSLFPGAGDHICYRFTSPATFCWGRNDHDEFGNGTTAPSSVPVATGLSGYVKGVTMQSAICGTDGKAGFCNGNIGGFDYNNAMVYVRGAELNGGANHGCALASLGPSSLRLHCWGDNSVGQLGDGTLVSSKTPVKVRYY